MQRSRVLEGDGAPAPFADRRAGGRALARMLAPHAGRAGTLVLALPRGGVPVGFEVARALRAPLDVLTVRKLGFPGHPELAMGAVASGGVCVLNQELVDDHGIPERVIAKAAEREGREVARREREYRGRAAPTDVRGRTVILVDDGLATGATMQAAVVAVRAQQPASVVVAVPVAARQSREEIGAVADEVVCVLVPATFRSVGRWYEDFEQVSDAEVRSLLELARALPAG
jgi:putative phosphoribosyl transferase